jgi:hypothetical protein
MSAGYGRGYYGEGQLAKSAPRRRNWFTIVAVLGVGAAVVWLLWPSKTAPDLGPIDKEPERLQSPQLHQQQSPLVVINTTGPASTSTSAPPAIGAFLKQLEDDARSRGFTSVKDYEDSMIASARQLQAAGAQVVLAPHLQHLAPQLGA